MPVSDEQVLRDRLDLEMLERPHLWKQAFHGMPALMMKKRDAGRVGYRWTGPCIQWGPDEWVISVQDWDNDGALTHRYYDSPEAILADGWVVD